MKRNWLIRIPFVIITLLFLLCFQRVKNINTLAYDGSSPIFLNVRTAGILAEAYVLSNPLNDPNIFREYINNYPTYFQEDGLIIQSAKNLGMWMQQHNKDEFDAKCKKILRKRLRSSNLSPEYVRQLMTEIKKDDFNCQMIADELIWLSEIIPELAKGNCKRFLCERPVERYNFRVQKICENVFHNSDPEIAEIISNDNNCVQKKMADQLLLLALIARE